MDLRALVNAIIDILVSCNQATDRAQTYLQLPLQQWGAGNVYLLVLSSWKVNIAVMGL